MPTFSPEPYDGDVGDVDVRGGLRKIRSGYDFNQTSPNLKRRILPTYRGRPVRTDTWLGYRRFYDDSAVFVGGVPLHETKQNLLERFSKHGKVVDLEYDRRRMFAEARIMYETKMGARSAMLYEVCGSPCLRPIADLAGWSQHRRVPDQGQRSVHSCSFNRGMF